MTASEIYGEAMLQRQEGNRQIASMLVSGVRVLIGRLTKVLPVMNRHAAGEHGPK